MPIGQVQSNTDNESKLVATSGGSAANFAVWLATLQIETHLFARVGKGDGKKFAAEFKTKNVIAHLQEDQVLSTGRIVVLIDGDNRTFFTDRGANQNLEVGVMPLEAFGDFLYISGYTVLSIGTEGTQKLMAMAKAHGMVTVCDPGSPTTAELVPGVAAKVVDPTGAGDAFAAMFMRTILDGDVKAAEAARVACAFAAEAMEVIGGQPDSAESS